MTGVVGRAEPHSLIWAVVSRAGDSESLVQGLRSSHGQEQGPSPPPLGGRGKGASWVSGMVLPICDMAVARRLGLHPEEDGEEQHYEEEEDGAADSQGHDHLCAGGTKDNVSVAQQAPQHLPGARSCLTRGVHRRPGQEIPYISK